MLLGILLVLQFPAVQTRLAQFAGAKLESMFNGRLEIGSIQIHSLNAITIRNMVLIDADPYTEDARHTGLQPVDTVASIGRLSATLSLKGLFHKKGFALGRVEAEDVLFQMAIEPDNGYGNNLTRVLKLKSSGKDTPVKLDSIFTVKRLKVTGGHFRMLNFNSYTKREHGINFSDMDVRFDVKGHSIGFHGGRMHAVVDEMKAVEKSGMNILGLSGSCHVGLGKTILEKLHLKDACGTDLRLDGVMSYDNTKAWSDFIHAVTIDADFSPSRLVLESISYFSGGTFKDCKFITDIAGGHFHGTVADFTAQNMVLNTPYGPYGTFTATMKGLPKIQETTLDAVIDGLHLTSAGLEDALKALGANANTSKFAPGTEMVVNGTANGPMNKMRAKVGITSSIGTVNVTANVFNMVDRKRDMDIRADMTAREFDLGRLLDNDTFGRSSFTAKAKGLIGHGRTDFVLEQFDVTRLGLLGYDYSGLHVEAGYVGKTLVARIHSDDPNAALDVDGLFDMDGYAGRFSAEFRNVDLAALNLDKRGGTSQVSFKISGNQGLQSRAPVHVEISDLILTSDKGSYNIGDIEAEARLDEDAMTVILNSGFMDAKYRGPSNISGLIKYAKSISVDRDLPSFFMAEGKEPEPNAMSATLSAVFHDSEHLVDFIMPGLRIAPETAVNLDIASDGTMLGYINAPTLDFNTIHAEDLKLALDNQDESLTCTVNTDILRVGSLSFDRACVNLDATNNLASLGVNYEGADLLERGSELNVEALLLRDEAGKPAIDVRTQQSYLRIKSDVWTMQKSEIKYHDGELSVDGFRLYSEFQRIALDGGISPSRKDTLQVDMRNIDLEILNEFTGESVPRVKGVVNGDLTLLSPVPSELGLWADIKLEGLEVDNHLAGDFVLSSTWDDARKQIHAVLDNTLGHRKMLNLTGVYGVKDKSVDAAATFDGFNVALGSSFLKNYLTELDGELMGKVHASGTTRKLKLSSDDLQLFNVRTRVSYTNVAYLLNGSISLDDNGLQFNDITVNDDYGGSGVLSGRLNFRELKDFKMDASLRMRHLKAIDIPTEDSPIKVYGDLALSGRSSISGPFNSLHVDADVSTTGAGNVNVPLSSSSTARGASDLLTFIQPELPEDAESEGEGPAAKHKSGSRFTAHARVNLSPDVTAHVEIDKESGHVLTAGGSGVVLVDINTAKDQLLLKGDYNIDKGKYLFTIPGVVSKEFDIKQGSSMHFNGKVIESTLDIDAIHIVKTSLASLVSSADSSAVSTRRPVECGINISGKISNPDVDFSINVPDLDPNTNMAVESALGTKDKVQKQFVALLLFGTFLPEDGSGVVNGTNMIASNVGEIVSSQLNNILQKLDIPLDFGLGYQQDKVGTDIFDVAVSTQLFNNRVLVNGSVGNRKYSTSKSAQGDVVGDLDIEIKLDRSGEVRFKLFSHSADEFSSSLDFSQRNGLGFSYQKEFDRTIDFLRQLFMSRQKRAMEMVNEMTRKREMTTIEVTKDDK